MPRALDYAALEFARRELEAGVERSEVAEMLREEFGQARRTSQQYVQRALGMLEGFGPVLLIRPVSVTVLVIGPEGQPIFRRVRAPLVSGESEEAFMRRVTLAQAALEGAYQRGWRSL